MKKSIPLHNVWHYTDVDRRFWQEHLEPWLPKQIFDAHTHINEPRYRLVKMTEEKRKQYWVNEVAVPIGAETAAHCHETVFPGREYSCLAFGSPSLDYDIEASNANLQAQCVDRDWYRLAVITPQWPAERVAAELDLPNVLGVKVYYSLISKDSKTRDKHLEASIFEFVPHQQLEVLNTRHAWLTLHVPKADRLGHPDNIREIQQIRSQYPDIILVIAHLGRCYTLSHAEESLPQLADDEGLYFDNSAVLNPDVHRFALEVLGPRRILYGTDNPIFYMRGRRLWRGRSYVNHTSYPFHFNHDREPPEVEAEYTLYMYEAMRALKEACQQLDLSRTDIEAIFSGNAQRLIASIVGCKKLSLPKIQSEQPNKNKSGSS